MSEIIKVKNLRKSYGNVEAVRGISFEVIEGSLFAFLGPNGAGKSTTIDTLCTLIQCDEGDVEICGLKLGIQDSQIRNNIGVVFQTGILDARLTIKENLLLRGSFYGLKKNILIKRIDEISQITGIEGILDRKYNKLSGGQRRRADIARAIIHEPRILFLDEPTTGLDPKTRKSIWTSIANMQKELGMTVFLTTHYLEEATSADEIIILKDGSIAESGSATLLKEKYAKDYIYLYSESDKVGEFIISEKRKYEMKQGYFKIEIKDKIDAMHILNNVIEDITGFEVIRGSMDDVFLNILEEVEE